MLVRNLGSGSGGNATVVAQDGRAILIDAGLPHRRIRAGLEGLTLEGVLITHRHSDHIGRGAERLGAPVWIERENWRDARRLGWIGKRVEHFDHDPFEVGPFRVTAVPLPHPGDAPWQSYGFLIERGRRRLAYATDLGHVPPEWLDVLSRAHGVFLESNHDPDMERESGRDPDHIDWVLSDHGHLSNEQCAEALARAKRAETVILGHLSRDCNRPELARSLARKAMGRGKRIEVASQEAVLDVKID